MTSSNAAAVQQQELGSGSQANQQQSSERTAASTATASVGNVTPLMDERFIRSPEQQYRAGAYSCLLYTSPSPRDLSTSRMPSSA